MKGLITMLKALGIKIPDEHVAALEKFLPELPARAQQAVSVVNNALRYYDEQFQIIKKQNAEILERLERIENARRPDNPDAGNAG